MIGLSGKQLALHVKAFLEIVQPLSVRYGYPRGVKTGEAFVTYQDIGSEMRRGIGNHIIGEWRSYIVTVQTKTAEQNLYYSDMIKYGTEASNFVVLSESMRKDATVDAGWINTIVLRVFNGLELEQVVFTAAEVREVLQAIADHYIFVTSIYAKTVAESFYDTMVVPELEDRPYSLQELLTLKQQYLDKLILNTKLF